MPERYDTERRIFAVHGVSPEAGGYSIAKFSRSARPYQEWIFDLTQEGAERFYETFYFDYGHASIADLAHITIVLENISMVAAEVMWGNPLADGQASSTRYQDFRKRGFITPLEIQKANPELKAEYEQSCQHLIERYVDFHQRITDAFIERYSSEKPKGMDQGKYERTLKARAFDVARYILPFSIRTGLGQIMSGRTLERQLIKLLSHPLQEVKEVGQEIKTAATKEAAFNPSAERARPILEKLEAECAKNETTQEAINELKRLLDFDQPALPTLVKYAEASDYQQNTWQELQRFADTLSLREEPDTRRDVHLTGWQNPEDEIVTTSLYRLLPHSYRQISNMVVDLRCNSPERYRQILDLLYRHRNQHDQPVQSIESGYSLKFDVCMDIGSWRDLHRHRRLVEVLEPISPQRHGFDTPEAICQLELTEEYENLMQMAVQTAAKIDEELPGLGQYALPLAFRRRALLKMDAAELQYITELRTPPANHFSVRRTAWDMYEAYNQIAPGHSRHIRAVDPSEENFFER